MPFRDKKNEDVSYRHILIAYKSFLHLNLWHRTERLGYLLIGNLIVAKVAIDE